MILSPPGGRRSASSASRWSKRALVAATALALALSGAGVASAASGAQESAAPAATSAEFGPNVHVFDPSMPTAEIQATVDAIAEEQVDNEMGEARYALLFKPGTYGTPEEPLVFQVGYYTEVAGLGGSPEDTQINGHVDVYNRCLTADNCIALTNFWRSISNLQINVMGGEGCRSTANFWAASQAAPMRRVKVVGGTLSLMDYCTAGPQYASGGFLADSVVPGTIVNGSQQQYLTRNSTVGTWSNAVWNQVFAGVEGAPATSFPNPPYTTLETVPLTREKPYLVAGDDGEYSVFVPAAERDTRGTTWEDGEEAGRSIALDDFFIASPSDSVKSINKALKSGKNLLLTPGVYNYSRPIEVKNADTVVLGLGLATITAVGGNVALAVADVPGVIIAAVTIDAGEKNSKVLLQVGKKQYGKKHKPTNSDPANPTTLSDVFFRIGGPHIGRASNSLEVNSDNVLLDHLWVWRADHGDGWGWDVNTAANGVIVNGWDVTATGLFVEHFQEYNTIWNGERGQTIFYQNELPYDAPNQEAWQHDGVLGWAAYKVADTVKTHSLIAGGAYVYTNVDPSLHATRGFEVPVTPGVKMRSLLTVNLGAGTIDHVVNDTGAPVNNSNTGQPSYVESFN